MRTALFLIVTLALNSACIAQDAKVLFFTSALPVKDALRVGIVPAGTMPFPGWLYDGNHRLAHFQRGRFVAFRFTPGQHTFSASGSSKQASSNMLSLNLVSGQTYCVRLSAKYVNWVVVPVTSFNGVIEKVPCEEAASEAHNDEPLQLNRIENSARPNLEHMQQAEDILPLPDDSTFDSRSH